ncbi:hypothetical protein GH742_13575 [Legionella sp. MW5194]|uniref:hypothetical protein n=1 Tax=Legionella sp. MW5194 TaxID=2662448 RepID=UPI00193E2944|nr:hypothetical protein [Legionella sp. MW5194]QRN04806.1 hypothetical protein GH742_13575 [Legionella sp. MW5194]
MYKLHDISEWVDNNWRPCPILNQDENQHSVNANLAITGQEGKAQFLVSKDSFTHASIQLSVRRGLFTETFTVKLTAVANPAPEKTERSEKASVTRHEQASASITHAPRELSTGQIEKLKAHKAKLENRLFEYRFFSYVFGDCFGKGYSKSEKIREIDNLLNGKDEVDMDVVQQGRTGRILRGN